MATETGGQVITATDAGVAISIASIPIGIGPAGGLYLLRLRNDSGDTHAYLIPPGQLAEGTPANAVKYARAAFGGGTATFGPYAQKDGAPLLQTVTGTAEVSAQILTLDDGEV
jgi:hypothetical protein